MTTTLPRVASVEAVDPTRLRVSWSAGGEDVVELAGWIASGDDLLAPLGDLAVFGAPRVALYGSAVAWGEEDGDLAIDAQHLDMIAREQRPFGAPQLAAWQAGVGLSNQEAADMLRISVSRYAAWKSGEAPVPENVAMLARAIQRDPVYLHAHYRPRKVGRPRKVEVAR